MKHFKYDELISSACEMIYPSNGKDEVDIRIFSLGQFRVGNEVAQKGLLGELYQNKKTYHTNASILFKEKIPKKVNNTKLDSQVQEILGDYDFYIIDKGVTPVECDVHLTSMPKIITKPRVVICAKDNMDRIHTNNKLGKLSLLKFHYRWESLKLFNKLENKSDMQCQFFISSGWEDAVLITWHENFSELIKDSEDLGLTEDVETGSCDSQTSLIPPSTQDVLHDSSQNNIQNSVLKLRLHVIRKYSKLSENDKNYWKTPDVEKEFIKLDLYGRHDNIFEFKNSDPKKYLDALKSLPESFWAGCQNFYTELSWTKSENKSSTSSQES